MSDDTVISARISSIMLSTDWLEHIMGSLILVFYVPLLKYISLDGFLFLPKNAILQ